MKKVFILCSIILSIFLSMACSNLSEDYGYVTLQMPGETSSGARAAYSTEHLNYDITITNKKTDSSTKYSAKPGETFSAELKIGTYDITVEALANNTTGNKSVIYKGTKNDVVIQGGRTTETSVSLKFVKESEATDINIIVNQANESGITIRTYEGDEDSLEAGFYVAELTYNKPFENVTWLVNGIPEEKYSIDTGSITVCPFFTSTLVSLRSSKLLLNMYQANDINEELKITAIVTYLDSNGNTKYDECTFNWFIEH